MAVQDLGAPFFDNKEALPDYERFKPFLSTGPPIENYKDLNLDPLAPYFNSGVMLIDLDGGRAESIADQCFSMLEKHRKYVRFCDQYALNIALTGRWGMLPMRWNSSAQRMDIPDASHCFLSPEAFEEARGRPEVIHYTGPMKPWKSVPRHRVNRSEEFHRVRTQTSWIGLSWFSFVLREFTDGLPMRIRSTRKAIKHFLKRKT